jgi:hypothetical protein
MINYTNHLYHILLDTYCTLKYNIQALPVSVMQDAGRDPEFGSVSHYALFHDTLYVCIEKC